MTFAASHALLVDTDCALDSVLGHSVLLGHTLLTCPGQLCVNSLLILVQPLFSSLTMAREPV